MAVGPQEVLKRMSGGFAATLAGEAGRFVVTTATMIIVARIIGPEAYGLTAMVSAVTGALALVNNSGLAIATIQRQAMSQRELTAIFWLQTAVGVGVALAGVAVAPILVVLYGDERVLGITIGLSLSFIPLGLAYIPLAIMRRELRFGAVVGVELIATVCSMLAAIGSALAGVGYWTLVIHPNVLSIATFLGVWSRVGWRPDRFRIDKSVWPLVAFGGPFFGHKVLEYASRQIDRPLLAISFGARTLGLYDRALALAAVPMSQLVRPLTAVLLPGLMRLQEEPQHFRSAFCGALGGLAWFSAPLGAFLAVRADDVVVLLLGHEWVLTGPLLRYVGLGLPFVALGVGTSWLFLALGRTGRMFRIGLLSSTLLFFALFVTAPLGAEFVAAVRSGVIGVTTILSLAIACRGTPVGFGEILTELKTPFLVAGLTAASALLRVEALIESPALRLAATATWTTIVTVGIGIVSGEHHRLMRLGRSILRQPNSDTAS